MVFAAIVLASVSLSGCGASSKDDTPDTGDYLANITTARWTKTVVTYRISPSTDVLGQDRTGDVERGLMRWQGALSGRHSLLPADRGVTELDYQDATSQVLKSAHCYINSSLVGNTVPDTAAHEMGHALGIRGHSNRKADLMNQNIPDGGRLAQRDVNTIQAIYTLPSPSPTPSRSSSPTPSPSPTPTPSPSPAPTP
jgi:hypothetical protein